MAKLCSDDLRSRVAECIASGANSRSIAAQFGLAPSTVIKRGESAARDRKRGAGEVRRPSAVSVRAAPRLGPLAGREVPHVTLHRLKDWFREHGVFASHDTVWRFLRREGLSFKK